MGATERTVGGGAAKPVANDFLNFLRTGLNSGTFGNGAVDSTKGIAGLLNDLLAGGAGNVGGAMGDMIARQRGTDVANLRARFGSGGGTAFGTPGAYAESNYLAESAERLPVAIGQLQLQALMPLLSSLNNATSLGTPQAQSMLEQNPWAAGFGLLADVGSAAFPFLKKAPLGTGTGNAAQDLEGI